MRRILERKRQQSQRKEFRKLLKVQRLIVKKMEKIKSGLGSNCFNTVYAQEEFRFYEEKRNFILEILQMKSSFTISDRILLDKAIQDLVKITNNTLKL